MKEKCERCNRILELFKIGKEKVCIHCVNLIVLENEPEEKVEFKNGIDWQWIGWKVSEYIEDAIPMARKLVKPALRAVIKLIGG